MRRLAHLTTWGLWGDIDKKDCEDREWMGCSEPGCEHTYHDPAAPWVRWSPPGGLIYLATDTEREWYWLPEVGEVVELQLRPAQWVQARVVIDVPYQVKLALYAKSNQWKRRLRQARDRAALRLNRREQKLGATHRITMQARRLFLRISDMEKRLRLPIVEIAGEG
jgi:hypothetical protein